MDRDVRRGCAGTHSGGTCQTSNRRARKDCGRCNSRCVVLRGPDHGSGDGFTRGCSKDGSHCDALERVCGTDQSLVSEAGKQARIAAPSYAIETGGDY